MSLETIHEPHSLVTTPAPPSGPTLRSSITDLTSLPCKVGITITKHFKHTGKENLHISTIQISWMLTFCHIIQGLHVYLSSPVVILFSFLSWDLELSFPSIYLQPSLVPNTWPTQKTYKLNKYYKHWTDCHSVSHFRHCLKTNFMHGPLPSVWNRNLTMGCRLIFTHLKKSRVKRIS